MDAKIRMPIADKILLKVRKIFNTGWNYLFLLTVLILEYAAEPSVHGTAFFNDRGVT